MHANAFVFFITVLLLESGLPTVSLPARAEVYSATVLKVSDGDTLTISHKQKRVKVRLAGIDCPEKAQPWGARARAMTASLSQGETVRINCVGRDRYGRMIADVDEPSNLSSVIVSAVSCSGSRARTQISFTERTSFAAR